MNMKKMLAMIMALCLALSLCACGEAEENATEATEATETTAATQATEATEETEPVDDGTVVYKATVVDEGGNPIPGAMVQICQDTCYPGVTNEEGVVEWSVAEADYKVTFLSMPEGYTYSTEEQEFHFESGTTEMTITLTAVA